MTDDTDQKAQEAAELAKSAAKDTGNAARKTVRAVQKGTGAAAEIAVDELQEARDKAQEVAEGAADKVQDVAEEAAHIARKVDVGVLSRISSDTGIGFLALSVSIYSGAVAFAKFRQAFAGRGHVLKG